MLSLSGTSEKLKLTSTGRLEQDLEAYLHWTDNGIEGFDADKDYRDKVLEYLKEQTKPVSKKLIGDCLGIGWRKMDSLIKQLQSDSNINALKSGRGYAYEVNPLYPLFPQSDEDYREILR